MEQDFKKLDDLNYQLSLLIRTNKNNINSDLIKEKINQANKFTQLLVAMYGEKELIKRNIRIRKSVI